MTTTTAANHRMPFTVREVEAASRFGGLQLRDSRPHATVSGTLCSSQRESTDDGPQSGSVVGYQYLPNRVVVLLRVSHPGHHGIAARLIVWSPLDENREVAAQFSGDKANMGDVFYENVGRAGWASPFAAIKKLTPHRFNPRGSENVQRKPSPHPTARRRRGVHIQ
jgi:hypothetical protein